MKLPKQSYLCLFLCLSFPLNGCVSWRHYLPWLQQRHVAKELTPETIEPETEVHNEQPTMPLSVRVYVTDGHRSLSNWKEDFQEAVTSANVVLKRFLNARLEVSSYRNWPSDRPFTNISRQLTELKSHDNAGETDVVILLAPALTSYAGDLHLLGRAHIRGQHMVVRAMDDAEEYRALHKYFDLISDADVRKLYRTRKIHKYASVLIHELGHMLGAPHIRERKSYMSPIYSHEVNHFSIDTLDLLRIGMKYLPQVKDASEDGLPALQKAWHDEIHARIQKLGTDLWEEVDYAYGTQDRSSQTPHRQPVPPGESDQEIFAKVKAIDQQRLEGDLDGTWPQLLELHKKHPKSISVLWAMCLHQATRPATAEGTIKYCPKVYEKHPDRHRLAIYIAEAEGYLGKHQEAFAALRSLEEKLNGSVESMPKTWQSLYRVYLNANYLSGAERALKHTNAQPGCQERWPSQQRRRRYALPVKAEWIAQESLERNYLERMTQLLSPEKVDSRKRRARVVAFEKDFPNSSGALLGRCLVSYESRQRAKALTFCQKALEKDPDAVFAHLLAGMILQAKNRHKVAKTHFMRVVELDPTLPGGWRGLEATLTHTGERWRYPKLKKDYSKPCSQEK